MTFTLRGDETLAEAEARAHNLIRGYTGGGEYTFDIHTEPSDYIVTNSSPREAVAYWEARVEVEIAE